MSKTADKQTLLQIADELSKAINFFRDINDRANLISLNAAIEGARMRAKAPSFSIVANQVQTQATKNLELSEKLEALVQKIHDVSLRATATRYFEMAEDLIDKVDRNLFERNCDVQAWATFESIRDCVANLAQATPEEARAARSTVTDTEAVLAKLVDTYMVYRDVILLNKEGVIVATAKHPNLVGRSCGGETWFETALGGTMHVNDMTFCPLMNGFSVYYSAPINDANGQPCGVVSTRFNWDYAQEMIDSAKFDKNVRAYFINAKAVVLGATDSLGTMHDAMYWLESGRAAAKGTSGYALEHDRNGSPIAIGFSRTKGYNSYRGLEWSSILTATIDLREGENHVTPVARPTAGTPVKAGDTPDLIESEKANEALRSTMTEVETLVKQINLNNRETKFLAINASIQSGIAGEDGEGFAIIAGEIAKLAKKSLEFVANVNLLAGNLSQVVSHTVDARLTDASKDAMDKVDRNLFERYCDVQAWTTFQQFQDVIVDGSTTNRDLSNVLLARLHQIYEVYHECILLDANGNVVSAAKDRALVGQNQRDRTWFQEALAGKVNFTEVYQSRTIGAPTVAFSAPIVNKENQVIGVLSTRFNCNFLNDILRTVIVDSRSEVFLTTQSGLVIATADGKSVLSDDFKHLAVFSQDTASGDFGLTDSSQTESAKKFVFSFAKGKGYNSYPGRNWCLVIRRKSQDAVAMSDHANGTGSAKNIIPLSKKAA